MTGVAGESRAPAALLPYQGRWVGDVSDVKVSEKSRRIGISWATASEAALVAASERGVRPGYGMDVFYVGYNRDMAQEFIRDGGSWARHFEHVASEIEEGVWDDGDEEILTYVIRFASGYRIVALSSRPSNLRGRQGYAILDEAAFHDHLPELLKAAMAFLMWGGRVAIISTHNGVENAFNEVVQDSREKRKPFALHRTTIDEALADGLYRRICLVRGEQWTQAREDAWRANLFAFYGDDAQEELLCVPKRSGGRYLPRALVEARMVEAPVVRFTAPDGFALWAEHDRVREVAEWCDGVLAPLLAALPRDLPHVFGEDFGRSSDLTVLAPGTLLRDLRVRIPFLVELFNTPYKQQEQALFYLGDRLPGFFAGNLDATGNGEYLAEQAALRYGAARIACIKISDRWYAEEMPRLKAAFQDTMLEIPLDLDVLSDFSAIQLVDGIPKLPKKRTAGSDGSKRHGDAAIAVTMAYAASRRDVVPMEFESTGPRTQLDGLDDRHGRDVSLARGFGVVQGSVNWRGF